MAVKEPVSIERFLKTRTGKALSEEVAARDNEMLQEAADEAGAPLDSVKRVFDLMVELDENFTALRVVDGDVVVVNMEDGEDDEDVSLPQSLWDKTKALDFDIVETLAAIHKAWLKRYGYPFPLLYVSG